MDGCAAEIAGDTLTDGMKSLYDPSNPAMAAKLDELSKTTADLVDTAKNAVAANSLYDNLTNLLTKSESEDHVGKISINSLENAINSIVPSLNDEVNRAQSLKAGVDDFMSGIGASNILQGGVWEDVKTNMETYQNLLDCNMKAAEFISDTIKTAMGVIVDYIEGSSDLISAVAKTDYGSFVSAGEMDDSRLGEIDNTLKTIAIQIEGIKRTIAEMKKAQECVEQSTIDSEGNVFSNQVCTPKYTDADIKPFEEELEKYKEAQTALTAYADRLRGFATVVQKAQQMINDAIEQVKNAYENPTLDANGNPTFAADFKLDMSAYGFEKDGDYYKNLIDDYYDKLNPKEPEKSTEGPTHPGDYFGGYGDPSGGTSGGSSNDTTEPETEVVTEVVSEANTEIVIERTTEMITEVPAIGPTEPKPKQGEGGSRKPQGPRNPYVEPTEDEPTIQNLPYEEIIDPNSEFYETEIKQPEIVNLDAIVEPTPAPQPDKSLRTMGVAAGVGVALGAAALGAHTIIQQKEDEEDEDKDYGFEK